MTEISKSPKKTPKTRFSHLYNKNADPLNILNHRQFRDIAKKISLTNSQRPRPDASQTQLVIIQKV